ncbi:hypothetical protein BJV77DRAFT_1031859, partial [Russula vinacea]
MRERHPAAKPVRDKVNQVKPSVGAQPGTGNTSVFNDWITCLEVEVLGLDEKRTVHPC